MLRLAHNLSLPLDTVTGTLAILATKGAGKTHLASVFAEELLKNNLPVLIIDPLDAFWGLRSSKDGARPAFPVTILGGPHGDIPLEPASGITVAEFVVEHYTSVILSLRHMGIGEQRRFVTDFGRRLFSLKAEDRRPTHLIVDECDEYAPQRLSQSTAQCFEVIDRIVRRARTSGIGTTLISQRPAAVNKDALDVLDTFIVLRTLSPRDRAQVEAWVEAHDTHGRLKEFNESLASLKRGEGWVWAPLQDLFQRVHFRDRETFDSSATPKVGQTIAPPKRIAAPDLASLEKRMAATIERAKAEDPRELRRQIAELKKQLASSGTKVPTVSPAALEKARQQGATEAERRLAREVERVKKALATLNSGTGRIEQAAELLREMVIGEAKPSDIRNFAGASNQHFAAPRMPKPLPERVTTSGYVRKSEENGRLPIGEHKTLVAIAQHEDGVSKKQLIVLTGYKRSSGDAYLHRLLNKDMIAVSGDTVLVTDKGVQALGSDFEPLPTGSALYEHWVYRLPEGERKVLEVLAAAYPEPVQRERIDEATGYMRSSRDAYLQRLRARRLVEEAGRGLVKASPLLFD